MKVIKLEDSYEQQYDSFLKQYSSSSFFASNNYRRLLVRFTGAEDHYLLALDGNNNIRGAFPLLMWRNKKYGTVINSLPFYGSNGGIICNEDDTGVKELLSNCYRQLLQDEKAVSGTIVSSPFESNNAFYDDKLDVDFKDSRIGQVTFFNATTDEGLMDLFHYKTRNSIRKGIKTGVTVSWMDGANYLDFLYETHKENMTKIGVAFKPELFFKSFSSQFEHGKDFRIYVAFKDNKPIAALLLFYFNKTVEYFTPATVEQFREFQPMHVIIYEAMRDAVKAGFSYWNWGGTGVSQKGVYDFKKRWGTRDLMYYYYTTLLQKDMLMVSRETLLQEYPFFYVVPFNALHQ